MDATGPTEGQRETGSESEPAASARRPLAPVDGQVVVTEGLVSFWCDRCARWVDAHIDVGGAKLVHEHISHPH